METGFNGGGGGGGGGAEGGWNPSGMPLVPSTQAVKPESKHMTEANSFMGEETILRICPP